MGYLFVAAYFASWLVNETIELVLRNFHLLLAKIEYNSLALFERNCREINTILANFNIRKSLSQILVVSPKRNDFSIEIN